MLVILVTSTYQLPRLRSDRTTSNTRSSGAAQARLGADSAARKTAQRWRSVASAGVYVAVSAVYLSSYFDRKSEVMAQVFPEGTGTRRLKNKKANKDKGEKDKEKKERKKGEKDPLAALRCANQALCSSFVYAPAYTCEEGHALCVTCVAFHAGRCPLCRAPLPRAVAFHLEERADHLLLACVYRSKGCHFRFPRDELVLHQVECRYARKQCFSTKCNFLGDNKELAAHMEELHSERVTNGMEADFTIWNIITRTDGVNHTQFMRNRLGNFWVKYIYSEVESQLYGAVQYIGPKQEAEKLEYQFEMKEYDDSKFTGLKTIFTGKMPTHVKSFEKIFASQDCFTVTLDFAEYFENNNALHLTVRVKPIDFP